MIWLNALASLELLASLDDGQLAPSNCLVHRCTLSTLISSGVQSRTRTKYGIEVVLGMHLYTKHPNVDASGRNNALLLSMVNSSWAALNSSMTPLHLPPHPTAPPPCACAAFPSCPSLAVTRYARLYKVTRIAKGSASLLACTMWCTMWTHAPWSPQNHTWTNVDAQDPYLSERL